MKRNLFQYIITCIIMCLFVPAGWAGYTFSGNEIRLVETGAESYIQTRLDPQFDDSGNVHFAWEDNRNTPQHVFGSTVLMDGSLLGSYPVKTAPGSHDHLWPNVLRSIAFPEAMYVLAYDNIDNAIEIIKFDLTQLPGSVAPFDLDSFVVSTASVTNLKAMLVLDHLIYGYEYNGSLYFGGYDLTAGAWDIEIQLDPPTTGSLTNLSFAKDHENFIYIAYNFEETASGENRIMVHRSQNAVNLTNGFHDAHDVTFASSLGAYVPVLAVDGSDMMADLLVSILFINPDPGYKAIECITEQNGDWSEASFNPLQTMPVLINDDPTSMITFSGQNFDAEYVGDNHALHVVWADDRSTLTADLYGDISYDYGQSFGIDKILDNVSDSITEAPKLAIGTGPAEMTISYIREDNAYYSPFALVSRPEFYDTCDVDPLINWDAAGGVFIDYERFHGLTGASYALHNNKVKGSLIRNYNSIEQTGTIDFFFYDTLESTPSLDFIVSIENTNDKGVIRMLGVRNDTSSGSYSFQNPSTGIWETWGGTRTVGWHNVHIEVTETGSTFELEAGYGTILTRSDPTFTSFTLLEIFGAEAGDPYNVDDVQVEVNPVAAPQAIPTLSTAGLMILLLIGGLGLVFTRRSSLF